jgi:large subunit ribosomal protein L23
MAFLKNFFKGNKAPAKKQAAREAVVEDTAMESAAPSILAPSNPILRSFHVSEKSARGMTMNQYTFIVHPDATKTQVRDAVRKSYKVDVVSVNLSRLPAKARAIGRHKGEVPSRRKAIVTLKEGQSIAAAQA